jgi:hypothetical protein
MSVKGVVGKSVAANFGVGTTSPSAIGVFSEIFTLDLGSECNFSFGHVCLLSVCSIDVVSGY